MAKIPTRAKAQIPTRIARAAPAIRPHPESVEAKEQRAAALAARDAALAALPATVAQDEAAAARRAGGDESKPQATESSDGNGN